MTTVQDIRITEVTPSMGVPGGLLTIRCRGFRPGLPGRSLALCGNVAADILSASEERIIIRLPDSPNTLGISLKVDEVSSPVFPFALATRLASGLHPVANPVIASDGTILTTISGSRGQQVPQPLIRVTARGEKIPLSCEITNPTGLAMDSRGRLHISSRHDGTVVRYTNSEQLEVIAEDAGIACGIAFDSGGRLYIGDRGGKIYCVDPSGGKTEYAVLEPSVSAYHLAFDRQDRLHVTGPTLSMRDHLYRISSAGRVEILLSGLARPQGIAFTPEGDLLVAAAYKGKKGVFRYTPGSGELVHYIAAPMLVGVAVDHERIILADNSSLYKLQPGWGAAQLV